MLAFLKTYLPEYLKDGKVYRLNTPVAASLKNKKPQKWTYTFDGIDKLKGEVKYFKGLGGWKPEQLKHIIEIDGLDKMLVQYSYSEDDDLVLDDWYSDKKADKRKELIMQSDFELIKI